MEKIRTEINKKVNYELSFRAFLTYAFFALVGVAGLIAGIIFGRVLGYGDSSVIIILVACSLLIAMGVTLIVMLFVKINKAAAEKLVIEAELLDDGILSVNYKGEEKTSESKISYGEFLFYRETKNYVYLFPNKVTALPMEKKEGLIDFINGKGIKKKTI